MALTYNGVTPSAITYNGVNLTQINYNGVTVWTSRVNLIYDGIIDSSLTIKQETYHTTKTSYSVVNNNYRVQGSAWSGANFGTTVLRLQSLNTSNFNTLTVNYTLSGSHGASGNYGYNQGYIALIPVGADYPKFTSYHQTAIISAYKGKYFSAYTADGPVGTYDIDISTLSGNYDVIVAISGYNAATNYVDIAHIIAH